MTVDGLDQSWGYADPAQAARAGIKVVSGYLSHDPSKNWTAAKIKAYHAHGIAVILNWESGAGRPLLGAQAGVEDATSFVQQAAALIAQVGYAPRSVIGAVFSCDRDTTPGNYPAIDAYYAATRRIVTARRFANGAYGEFDLIEHLHAAGLTTVEWQTLAWSGGRISGQADFYQSSINNTFAGASVDFDRILHATQLGAWWPPGHPLDVAAVTPDVINIHRLQEDDEMKRLSLIRVGRKIYITDRIWIEYIPNLAELRRRKADLKAHGGDPTVYQVPTLAGYGKLVTA